MSDGNNQLSVISAPYLPLRDPVSLDDWWIGPLQRFEGPWPSERVEETTRALCAAFRDGRGRPLATPTLIVPRGAEPNREQLLALQRALDLTVLDGNGPFDPKNDQGWTTATSDNSRIEVWPIDMVTGAIAISRGTMVRGTDLGWRLGQNEVVVRAPIELHMPRDRYLDAELLDAAYRVFSGQHHGDPGFAHRLGWASTWLAQAWRNTESVRWTERVVMLKTAFEAITAESTARASAEWLEARFDTLRPWGITDFVAQDLLWSPSETAGRAYADERGRQTLCTDLGHWFRSFGRVRNQIIHDGTAPSLQYQEAGSAYCGSMVFVGERLVRESIRLCFADFGDPELWKSAASRAVARAFAVGPITQGPPE